MHLSADAEYFSQAVAEARGSITRAAQALGISKTWAMMLAKRFELNDWARELRQKNGLPATGRPYRIFPIDT